MFYLILCNTGNALNALKAINLYAYHLEATVRFQYFMKVYDYLGGRGFESVDLENQQK